MKKNILILFFLFTTQVLIAQQEELHIDYSEIQQKITDESSPYYYPTLLKKFNEFAPSLTLEEYALIYYGFTFQDDYLKNQPDERKLAEYADNEEYERLISECKKILKRNPVSLKANNYIGYAYHCLDNQVDSRKYQERYRMLRRAIVYSGNGLSPETAFKVIYVSDEYEIVYRYFEISNVYGQSLVGLCDRLEVEPSDYYQVDEIYFDISRKLIRQQQLLESRNK